MIILMMLLPTSSSLTNQSRLNQHLMISQLPKFQFHNLCQCNSEVFLKLDQIATESTESVVLVAIKNTSKIDQFQKFSETINIALTD